MSKKLDKTLRSEHRLAVSLVGLATMTCLIRRVPESKTVPQMRSHYQTLQGNQDHGLDLGYLLASDAYLPAWSSQSESHRVRPTTVFGSSKASIVIVLCDLA